MSQTTEPVAPIPQLEPGMLGPQKTPGTRSSIPRVVGILAIVFSVLGIFGAIIQTVGPSEDLADVGLSLSDLGAFGTWAYAYMALSVVVFGLHLFAGILCVGYRRRSVLFTNIYGIANFALIAANVALSFMLLPEEFAFLEADGAIHARVVIEFFALPWTVTFLALMNSERAVKACRPNKRRD